MTIYHANVGGLRTCGLSALSTGGWNGQLLTFTFVEQSRIRAKSIAAAVQNGTTVNVSGSRFNTRGQQFVSLMKPLQRGRETVVLMTLMNKEIGKRFLLTDVTHLNEDFHSHLMNRFILMRTSTAI